MAHYFYPVPLLGLAICLGCASEREQQLTDRCIEDFYEREHANNAIMKMISTKDADFWRIIYKSCRIKVDYFLDGYRVQPIIESTDPISIELGLLRQYYEKKFACEADQNDCE